MLQATAQASLSAQKDVAVGLCHKHAPLECALSQSLSPACSCPSLLKSPLGSPFAGSSLPPSQPSSRKVVSPVPDQTSYLPSPLTQNYSSVPPLAATPLVSPSSLPVPALWHFRVPPTAFLPHYHLCALLSLNLSHSPPTPCLQLPSSSSREFP